jgi:hypothetical protein
MKVLTQKRIILAAMKRRLSNPFRVILSGVLDFLFFVMMLFVCFMLFDRNTWRIRLQDRVFPVVNLLVLALTVVYILFLLPLLDFKGGSLGKRALNLKCISQSKRDTASFGRHFLKNLTYGIPVLFVFAMSVRLLGMDEDNVVLAIRLTDAVILFVFLIQAVSVFIGKQSLFEKISRSIIVPKKYFIQPEFSFEKSDTLIEETERVN